MNKFNKTPYSKTIAARVIKGIKGGVPFKTILASCANLKDCPASYTTFMKLYGTLIYETQADLHGEIGEVVYKQARGGDFKAAEFVLRSKGGWSPNSTVNEVDQEVDPDEDESAIDTLMTLLGKDEPDEEEKE